MRGCDAPGVLFVIDEWLGGSLLGVLKRECDEGGAPSLAQGYGEEQGLSEDQDSLGGSDKYADTDEVASKS